MTASSGRARLVTVAHGTRQRAANRIAAELTAAAGDRLGMPAEVSYVELHPPLFADVVAARDAPRTVVVPLLLSTGFHLRTDLPAAVAEAPGEVTLGGALGPAPLLARAQADRLRAAGLDTGHPVVMVAAGSRDPAATASLHTAAELLAECWGGPVRIATLAGRGDRISAVVRPGDAVSPYLLAPGHFADLTRTEGLAAGAAAVAEVIGPHPRVVDLVVDRARALLEAAD